MHRVIRVGRVAAGGALLVVGLAMIVLPGPGIPVLFGGLLLLEREFHWARGLRLRLVETAKSSLGLGQRAARWVRGRGAHALALLARARSTT